MSKITPFLLSTLLFSACHNGPHMDMTCPLTNCPAIFNAPLLITYLDKTNARVAVADFNVTDLRTNQLIITQSTVLFKPRHLCCG